LIGCSSDGAGDPSKSDKLSLLTRWGETMTMRELRRELQRAADGMADLSCGDFKVLVCRAALTLPNT
jgi:hypothetical protein